MSQDVLAHLRRASSKGPSAPLLPLLVLGGGLGTLVWRVTWCFRQDSFTDDGYYYAVIARNLAERGQLTFDGVEPTNGFHPLWLGLQALLYLVRGSGPTPRAEYDALVLLSAGTLLVFLVGMAWLVLRRYRGGTPAATWLPLCLGVALAFHPPVLSQAFNGMESTLTLPLAALLYGLLVEERWSLAGWAGALLVLSRLDTAVFVIAPVVLFFQAMAWRRPDAVPMSVGPRIALPPMAALGGWMVFNLLRFGRSMPISGASKSTFPLPSPQWDQLFGPPSTPAFRTMAAVVVLAAAATSWTALRARRSAPAGAPSRANWDPVVGAGQAMTLAAVCLLASLLLFQRWRLPVPAWYLPLPAFAAFLGIATAALPLLRRPRGVVLASAVLLVTSLNGVRSAAGSVRYALTNPGFQNRIEEIAGFMRASPLDSWATTDAGMVAFWSGEPVVNLDGLVNSWSYQDALRDGELGAYLAKRGVEGLIASVRSDPRPSLEPMYGYRSDPAAFDGSYDALSFWVWSHIHHAASDTLSLVRGREVFRGRPHDDGGEPARFLVFDLRPERP